MPEHPGFDLRQINNRSMIRLRVRPAGADAASRALQLPQQALQWRGEDPMACWLGPDQWLLTSDSRRARNIISRIDSTLSGQLYAATDMSSANACFALRGSAARTILAMGCGCDMHPQAFTAGQCVRTHFASVAVLIVAVDADCFNLYVTRSLARYLHDWLIQAGEDPYTHELRHQ